MPSRLLLFVLPLVAACGLTGGHVHESAAPLVIPFDVVRLLEGDDVAGRDDLVAEHLGFRYRFADEASRARFLGEPEAFAIQLGGSCGRMGALSGRGDPDLHAVHDGKVYLFASESCRETFLAGPDALLPPAEAPVHADAVARDAGRALVERTWAAHGGERVDAVRTLVTEHARERGQDARPYTTFETWTARFGDDGAAELARTDGWFYLDDPDGAWSRRSVTTPRGGWIVEDDGARPLHPSQRAELVGLFARHPLAILRARQRADFVASPAGANHLAISFDGTHTVLELGDDGRIVAASWTGRGPGAAFVAITRTFGDYAEVDGVWLPRAWTDRFDGEAGETRRWTSVAVDADVGDAFVR